MNALGSLFKSSAIEEVGNAAMHSRFAGREAQMANAAAREGRAVERITAANGGSPGPMPMSKTKVTLGADVPNPYLEHVLKPQAQEAYSGLGGGPGSNIYAGLAPKTTPYQAGTGIDYAAPRVNIHNSESIGGTAGSTSSGSDGKLGMMGLFKHAMEGENIGARMLKNGLGMGAVAGAGSLIYGGLKVAAPNNASVNDPIKNMVKGAMVGVAGGALMAASHGLSASSLTKLANPEALSKLAGVQSAASMTQGFMKNAAVGGAVAAALVAGSGDANFTKPLNPVY